MLKSSKSYVYLPQWNEWSLLSRVQLFATPWTVAYHAPPSVGFSRQEYWSGLPFPSPGDLSDPGIEPQSPALQADKTGACPLGSWSAEVLIHKGSAELLGACMEGCLWPGLATDGSKWARAADTHEAGVQNVDFLSPVGRSCHLLDGPSESWGNKARRVI